MRIKADWTSYLHDLSRREMDVVFRRCPRRLFKKGLELGAGDGFASTILAGYAEQLVCTELNAERLARSNKNNVVYKICDAEEVGEIFEAREFDMVFSSSLLEHLPDCERALRGVHRVLDDDGISIHLMPNRYWKLATILLHMPNKLTVAADKVLAGQALRRRAGHKLFQPCKQRYGGNNLKLGRRKQFSLKAFSAEDTRRVQQYDGRIHSLWQATMDQEI
jgi:SAM-dependent methyltransferase